jgi:hypothetical protein
MYVPTHVWIDKKRYPLGRCDEAALRRLWLIAEARKELQRAGLPLPPLLTYRQTFRQIIRDQPVVGLLAATRREDSTLRLLAVWLLGRCRAHRAAGLIAEMRNTTDRGLRKQVAKALARLEAWPELRRLHELEPDPVIRRLSAGQAPRPLAERLERYARQVENIAPVTGERMPLVTTCEPTAPSPPKSRHVIRRLLEHIAALVRGKRAGNGA